jgi:predicted enzyme related to lactoylglutathione lyase
MAMYAADGSETFDPTDWDRVNTQGGVTGTTTPSAPSPWSGAPTNNPTAAPEQGYWGSYTGTNTHEYTPQQADFDSFFKDYWAPDRSSVLASKRYQPPSVQAQTPNYQQATGQTSAPMQSAWDEHFFANTFGRPNTVQELLALEQRINAAGGKVLRNAQGVAGKIQDPSGRVIDPIFSAGTGGRGFQWLTDEGGGGAPQGGGFRPNIGGSAFSDPATAQWEQLLRQMVERLNQPIPQSTHELQQTQALDPLERQRQQQKQRAELNLAQRNIRPGSGIFEESMRDIDRQFNELRTRTQAGFANTAAQQTEDRQLAGVNLFKQIPQYQDVRLQLAQQALMPANPMQLLSLQQNQQQMANQNQMYNNAQNQQFWQWLGTVLAGQF